MLVNLSFELEPDEITTSEEAPPSSFEHLGEANYKFSGEVVRAYEEDEPLQRLIVLECPGFMFYLTGPASSFRVGDKVEGRGTLLLDHYLWVEFLHQYPDPPNLFYKLRVERIWRNQIPDRYIHRTSNALSRPTRLPHSEGEPIEVRSMESDSSAAYYVVEFSDDDIDPETDIPRTFLG